MLYAQATTEKKEKIAIYEQVLALDKKEQRQPDLGMLTFLYSAYQKRGKKADTDRGKELDVLKILAYRTDYPGRKNALKILGSLALERQDWLVALQAHEELLKLEPLGSSKDSVIYLDNAVFIAEKLQKDQQAYQLLRSKLRVKSTHIPDADRLAAYRRAMAILRTKKDVKGAEKLYRQALKAPFQAQPYPQKDQLHLFAALNFEEARQPKKALTLYQKSLDLDLAKLTAKNPPKNLKKAARERAELAKKILALTQRAKGDEIAAQKQLLAQLKAAQDKPAQAKWNLILAQKLAKKKSKKKALPYYQKSLKLYQSLEDSEKVRQLLTLIANLSEGGKEKLKNLLALESKQSSSADLAPLIATRVEIGNLYRQQGQLSKAEDYYRDAFLGKDLPPTKDRLWAGYYLAGMRLAQGALKEALTHLDQALKLSGSIQKAKEVKARLHQSKAKVLTQQGQHDAALAEIDLGLKLAPQANSASLLEAKASILVNAGRNQAAENLLRKAAKGQSAGQQISSLILLARAQAAQNRFTPALSSINKAIRLKGGEVDPQTVQTFSLKAYILHNSGKTEKAIQTMEELIQKLQLAEDKNSLAKAYLQVAGYQINQGNLDQADQNNQNAAQWAGENDETLARIRLNAGKIAIKQEKFNEALTRLEEEEPQPTSPQDLRAEYYYQRGYARLQLSKFDEAKQDFEMAQQLYQELGRKAQATQAQMAQANVLLQLGKMTEAEDLYKELLEQAEKETQGDIQNAMAFLYAEMGQYEKAQKLSLAAEKNYQSAGQINRIPEVLNARGLTFLKMNDFAQAELSFKAALKKNESYQNPLLDSELYNNLGGLYKSKGDLDRAQEQLLQAAQLQKKLGFESQLALTYNNIGSVYLAAGKEREALDFLKKSRNFSKKFGLKKELATSWNNEGILYFKKNQLGNAESAFQEAMKLQRELELRLDLARTLNNLSIIQSRKKNLKKALKLVQEAVAALATKPLKGKAYPNPPADGLLAPDMLKGFLMNKGGFLKALAAKSSGGARRDYLEAAYLSFALSIDLIESLRSQIKGEESQQMLMQSNIDIYQQLISILFDLGELDPTGGFHEKAFYYAEASRARSFLDRLAEQAAKAAANLPPKIRQKEKNLKDRVTALDQKIFVELKKPKEQRKESLIEEWQTQKTGLQIEYKKFTEELEKKFPEFAALKYPKVYGVKDVQAKLLSPKAEILLYFLGEDRSYGFLVSLKKFKMLRLPPNGDIDALIRKYRTTLKDPLISEDPEDEDLIVDSTQSHVATGLQIFRTLLEPLLQVGDPNTEELAIIPDGVLYYLPFETVVIAIHPQESEKFAQGREYMLHRYAISYSPSASVLGNLQAQVARRDPAEMRARKAFIGFGDPQYKPKASQSDSFHYNPTLQQQGFYDLSRLFNTIKELKAISSVFPNSNKIFLRDTATESAVKKNLKGYKYIHFATHGILDERNPEFSGVVMNLVKIKKPQDGFLQASEIFDLNLNSDMVVLSACETGLGKVIKGEGMVGLTRAFLYAGTPSIVVSLWTVADDSTSKLMIYFYQQLAKGLPRDQAMRQAKLQLMNETQGESYIYSDPFYWGPFILNGTRS